MEFVVPDGYSVMEIDGKPVEYQNHVLLVRDEDGQQIWIPLTTTTEKTEETESNGENGKRMEWSEENTLLFISLLEKYKGELNDPKRKKKAIHTLIAQEMAQATEGQHSPSAEQCDNHYKSLVKKFREIRDHNNGSGKARKDWVFYTKMADFFGDRPNVTPVSGCSSLELTKDDNLRKTLTQKLKRPIQSSENEKPVKSMKKTKVRSEVLKVLQSMESKVDEREERKMQMMQQQHEDFKIMMSRMLDIMDRKN